MLSCHVISWWWLFWSWSWGQIRPKKGEIHWWVKSSIIANCGLTYVLILQFGTTSENLKMVLYIWCNVLIYKSRWAKITSLLIQTSFFMCKWFSTGGSLISDFPKSTLAWHLVDEMLVYGCCYGSKMMVCWRSENWPSFLYGPAKNFSCSVKNYDLLIVTLGRKIDFMLTEISKCVWPSPIDFSNKVKKSWTKKS